MKVETSVLAATMLIVGAGALIPPSPALARANGVRCGATITQNTRLQSDLIHCPGAGLVIGADHITLDLNGHTVAGAASVDEPSRTGGIDNQAGHDGVTVKNGTVRGFPTGVVLIDATGNQLRNLVVTANEFDGVLLVDAARNRIENNVITRNRYSAIIIFQSSGNVVSDNWLADNGYAGVFLPLSSDNEIQHNTIIGNEAGTATDTSDRNVFSHNQLSHNRDGMIVSGSHNVIAENRVDDTGGCPPSECGFGISLEDGDGNRIVRNDVRRTAQNGIRVAAYNSDRPTVNSVVRDNDVRGASVDGISVAREGDGTLGDTFVIHNTVSNSGDDGYDIRSAATALTNNRAVRNHDLGIDAVDGVIDGGGNAAFANGNAAQCIGITCK